MYQDYSIHTFTLQTQISYINYISLTNHFFQKISQNKYSYENIDNPKKYTQGFKLRQLNIPGINSITLKCLDKSKSMPRYFISIEINLQKAISSESSANIIKPKKIEEAMSTILHNLTLLLPLEIIDSLHFKRIDFCSNIICDDPSTTDVYIKLFKKGILPKALHEHKFFSHSQHRKVTYNDSFLLECKSYSFQIYNKEKQMISRNLSNSDSAHGMIRFELRAERPKIKQLSKKYDFLNPDTHSIEFLQLCTEIGKKEMTKLYNDMYGQGNFFSYTYVKRKVLDSEFKQGAIDDMLMIIKYLSNHSSSENLFDDLHLSPDKYNRLLKKFNTLNCSPITIPVTYGIEYLPKAF